MKNEMNILKEAFTEVGFKCEVEHDADGFTTLKVELELETMCFCQPTHGIVKGITFGFNDEGELYDFEDFQDEDEYICTCDM